MQALSNWWILLNHPDTYINVFAKINSYLLSSEDHSPSDESQIRIRAGKMERFWVLPLKEEDLG